MGMFSPMTLRGVTLRNRIAVSPMCQYSSVDGFATDWHLVHLGARAVGGAGLVMAEATAVVPEGRISPHDLGIWDDAHVPMLARIAKFIKEQGAVPAIHLAHAGRKASTQRPWEGHGVASSEEGGWDRVVAPSAIAFSETYHTPVALTEDEIADVVAAFARAAERARDAGFQIAEIHAAHGYLLHQFFSPLSNHRQDRYGGSFENRTRIAREVVTAIRNVWPENLPLMMRVSATDWVEGGWHLGETVALAKEVRSLGVDMIDCSSGGLVPRADIPVGPDYQVPFSRAIRDTGMPTAAVGLITKARQADAIVQNGDADVVMLAREFLRDPNWPLHAARELDVFIQWPPQYERARD